MTLPLHWINLFAYLLNAVITYGVGVGWLGNLPDNATLSRKYQTIVTPAGWAFAIWGVIFTAQLVWALYQQHPRFKTNAPPPIQAVGLNYLWVCLAQAGWTLTFTNELIPASLVCMVLILLFLAIIVKNLYPLQVNYAWKFPFFIHFGWIAAATAVNTSVVLVWLQLSATVQFWAGVGSLLLLLLVGGVALTMDYTVPAVLAWALVGIYAELNRADATINTTFASHQVNTVRIASLAGATLILAALLAKALVSLKKPKSHQASTDSTEEGQYLRADD